MFNDYEHIEDIEHYSYQELEIVVNEWWNSLLSKDPILKILKFL